MVSAGSYVLSAALLAALVLSLAFSAHRLRARLIPAWTGAPARLVEAILAIALLIWLAELLGIFSLLYAWTLVACRWCSLGRSPGGSDPRSQRAAPAAGGGGEGGPRTPSPTAPPFTTDRTRGPESGLSCWSPSESSPWSSPTGA